MTPVAPSEIAQLCERPERKERRNEDQQTDACSEGDWIVSPAVSCAIFRQQKTLFQRVADNQQSGHDKSKAKRRGYDGIQLGRTWGMSSKSWLFRSAHADIILG